jgi:predicted ester cyclase
MFEMSKAVVREFYESYNEGDLDRTWERFIAPGIVNHAMGGAYDREGWLESDKSLLTGFSDLHVEVLDQVAEGDKVATRYTITGTQTGEFFGIPAGGVTATLSGTSLDRIADGKIVEHWADADLGGFIQQLAPSPAS